MTTELNLVSLLPLMPVFIVSITSVLVMLLIAIKRHHTLSATVTVLGLNAALAWIIFYFINGTPTSVMGLFMIDGF